MNRHIRSSFAGLCLLGVPCVAQVPNGGFENWSDVGGYDDPDQWVSYNSISFPIGGVLTCEQGAPGAVGASYVQLTTATVPGVGVIPGTLYSTSDMLSPEGFPHTVRSGALTGQWKYAVQPGDQALITVGMSKWNTTTQQRDVIGAGVLQATGSLANWDFFYLPISFINAETPDTALIYIMSSSGAGIAGSTISVDDLAFDGIAGMQQPAATPEFQLYPSPATDVLCLTAGDRITNVAVVDLSGREVRNAGINGSPVTVNINELPAGMYIARVRFADGRIAARPFVKN